METAVLGCGKMGAALVKGMIRGAVVGPESVALFDVDRPAMEALAAETGGMACGMVEEAVARAEVVLICVKPADVAKRIESIRALLVGKLLVSIAAGVTLGKLEAAAGDGVRVARVMPNTPALIGRGVAGYALGGASDEADAGVVERIFGSVGRVYRVKEALLDAVTAVSGSGPAYVFYFIEALAAAGESVGLTKELAMELAIGTVSGAGELVVATGEDPGKLREMVTSPAGTTLAGLNELEKAGLRGVVSAAVQAAARRSAELGAS
jgi:pyrroline-5-carboxylate reductase